MSFGHWCNGEADLPLAGWAGTGKMGGRNRQPDLITVWHFCLATKAAHSQASMQQGGCGAYGVPRWYLVTLAFVHQCTSLTPRQPRRAHFEVVNGELVPQGTTHKVPPTALMFWDEDAAASLRRRRPCPPPMAGPREEGDREVFELMDVAHKRACRARRLPSLPSWYLPTTYLDPIYPRSPQSTCL